MQQYLFSLDPKDVEQKIKEYLKDGYYKFKLIYRDGSEEVVRLWETEGGYIASYYKRARKWGYAICLRDIVKVIPLERRYSYGSLGYLYRNLESFIRLALKFHPNLLYGYLAKKVEGWDRAKINSIIMMYSNLESLLDYLKRELDTDLVKNWFESRSSMQKIYLSSLQPLTHRDDEEYKRCLANIKSHLDNSEPFKYFWCSTYYDVTVEARPCVIYDGRQGLHGTVSLEYRGLGNGHYYILVNDKLAAFHEED